MVKSRAVHFERKAIATQYVAQTPRGVPELFSLAIKDAQPHSSFYFSNVENVECQARRGFEDWRRHIDSIEIDFSGEFDSSVNAFRLTDDCFASFKDAVLKFMEAIKDYREHQKEAYVDAPQISKESAKNFLFLIPVLAGYSPKVYIDANNGCFTFDIVHVRDHGILSTQISENGQIYYSLVSNNKKIYKITGMAKFKASEDFIKFNRVLQML